jgi:hypothetical protein
VQSLHELGAAQCGTHRIW